MALRPRFTLIALAMLTATSGLLAIPERGHEYFEMDVTITGAQCGAKGPVHFTYEMEGRKRYGSVHVGGYRCNDYRRGQVIHVFIDSTDSGNVGLTKEQLDQVRALRSTQNVPFPIVGWILLMFALPFIKFLLGDFSTEKRRKQDE